MNSFSNNRMNRMSYFLWQLVIIAGALVVDILFFVAGVPELAKVTQLICAIFGFALTVKRLHDMDRSGWWILAPYALLIVGVLIIIAAGNNEFLAAVSLAFMAPAVLFQPALFFWPGTKGPNRFGPGHQPQTNMVPAE